jgi:predicted alpha/beta hydrolase family esterase
MVERKHAFPFLIIPGLGGSGDGHWQALWRDRLTGAEIVPQLDWNRPDLSLWLNQLQAHVERRPGSILVGHSLGSILIAHLAQKAPLLNIAGAMLVAPADVENCKDLPDCAAGFAPIPRKRLPFPSSLVTSSDDPYISIARAHVLARSWGSQFYNVGSYGHINLAAGFGSWPEGERILDILCEQVAFENRSSRRSVRRIAHTA